MFSVGVAPVSGQVFVAGDVLDEATQEPILSATVLLLDLEGDTLRGGLTTMAGSFLLEAPRSGRYRLRVGRIGYEDVVSAAVDLLPRDTLHVEVRLSAAAVVLAPLTVTSDRPALVLNMRLARWGYYERKAIFGKEEGMGFGYFLDYEDIERRQPFTISDLLRGLAGLKFVAAGGRRVEIRTRRRGCSPTFYLDGTRFLLRGATIDEFVHPTDLVAVEVYPGMVTPGRFAGCASIVLWTGLP
ncbi:MAG: carboxypeptidase-like regulatory domain-containing protein [Longimicrobiales bacterium]